MGDSHAEDNVQIRPAKKEDMSAIAEMIQELADFEKMPTGPKLSVKVFIPKNASAQQLVAKFSPANLNCVNCTHALPMFYIHHLEHDGFERAPPAFQCKIAVDNSIVGSDPVVGYALYFPTYSTWQGRSLMLEDLYVRPSQRRKGVGKKLFKSVAQEARSTGCSRLDFHVLEWNPARSFYEYNGAVNLTSTEQWCYYRLAGDALTKYTDAE